MGEPLSSAPPPQPPPADPIKAALDAFNKQPKGLFDRRQYLVIDNGTLKSRSLGVLETIKSWFGYIPTKLEDVAKFCLKENVVVDEGILKEKYARYLAKRIQPVVESPTAEKIESVAKLVTLVKGFTPKSISGDATSEVQNLVKLAITHGRHSDALELFSSLPADKRNPDLLQNLIIKDPSDEQVDKLTTLVHDVFLGDNKDNIALLIQKLPWFDQLSTYLDWAARKDWNTVVDAIVGKIPEDRRKEIVSTILDEMHPEDLQQFLRSCARLFQTCPQTTAVSFAQILPWTDFHKNFLETAVNKGWIDVVNAMVSKMPENTMTQKEINNLRSRTFGEIFKPSSTKVNWDNVLPILREQPAEERIACIQAVTFPRLGKIPHEVAKEFMEIIRPDVNLFFDQGKKNEAIELLKTLCWANPREQKIGDDPWAREFFMTVMEKAMERGWFEIVINMADIMPKLKLYNENIDINNSTENEQIEIEKAAPAIQKKLAEDFIKLLNTAIAKEYDQAALKISEAIMRQKFEQNDFQDFDLSKIPKKGDYWNDVLLNMQKVMGKK